MSPTRRISSSTNTSSSLLYALVLLALICLGAILTMELTLDANETTTGRGRSRAVLVQHPCSVCELPLAEPYDCVDAIPTSHSCDATLSFWSKCACKLGGQHQDWKCNSFELIEVDETRCHLAIDALHCTSPSSPVDSQSPLKIMHGSMCTWIFRTFFTSSSPNMASFLQQHQHRSQSTCTLRNFLTGNTLTIKTSPDLAMFEPLLYVDPSFSVGFGFLLRHPIELDQPDILITSHADAITSASSCPIIIHVLPDSTYTMIRKALGDMLEELIQSHATDKKQLKVAGLLVWAGWRKVPPDRFVTAALSFSRSSPHMDVYIVTEQLHREAVLAMFHARGIDWTQLHELHDNKDSNHNHGNIFLVTEFPLLAKGNLTKFMHLRLDQLVPEIAGHHHYALGWGLCDLRWLFGAIFDFFLSQRRYSHWAWIDSDAVAGDVFGAITHYGRDFIMSDVVSFAHVDANPKHVATTVMAYSSGTFTVIKYTDKGNHLFRHTPQDLLHHALARESNSLLDEVGTPNAVMGALNVTVTLVSSQLRNKGIVIQHNDLTPRDKIFYFAEDTNEFATRTTDMAFRLGRIDEPHAVSSLGQVELHRRFSRTDVFTSRAAQMKILSHLQQQKIVAGFLTREIQPHDYVLGKGGGTGFASLLRDDHGAWWHRPYPTSWITLVQNNVVLRVQIAIAHIRSEICIVNNVGDDLLLSRSELPMNETLRHILTEIKMECKKTK